MRLKGAYREVINEKVKEENGDWYQLPFFLKKSFSKHSVNRFDKTIRFSKKKNTQTDSQSLRVRLKGAYREVINEKVKEENGD